MNIQQIWQKITNLGVDEAELGRTVIKVRLLNQLMFVTFMASTSIIIIYLFTEANLVIFATTMANMVIEILGLSLAYQKRHQLARHVACIFFPTWIAFNTVINGGGVGEANIFLGLGFSAFILYEGQKKLQIPIVTYIVLLFIISKLYLINHVGVNEISSVNPYDELITLPIILVVLGLIMVVYQNEIKPYDKQIKQTLDTLEHKNKQLAQMNNELEQFSYIASHDLKTPLRTITSHLDLIQRHIKKQDFEAVEEDINFAKNGAKQMYALISDILEYKKVSNSDEAIAAIDLEAVALQVTEQMGAMIKEKNAMIEVKSLPSIEAKHSDMVVLFQNIIENGIKYNESEIPKVIVSSTVSNQSLTIQFFDNGIGIDGEYHERIFQFFKRLHRPDEYEGTGIGLGLCQKIVQNYNGQISVQANPTGGSIFEVKLPV